MDIIIKIQLRIIKITVLHHILILIFYIFKRQITIILMLNTYWSTRWFVSRKKKRRKKYNFDNKSIMVFTYPRNPSFSNCPSFTIIHYTIHPSKPRYANRYDYVCSSRGVWPWPDQNSKKPHQWQIEERNQREARPWLEPRVRPPSVSEWQDRQANNVITLSVPSHVEIRCSNVCTRARVPDTQDCRALSNDAGIDRDEIEDPFRSKDHLKASTNKRLRFYFWRTNRFFSIVSYLIKNL